MVRTGVHQGCVLAPFPFDVPSCVLHCFCVRKSDTETVGLLSYSDYMEIISEKATGSHECDLWVHYWAMLKIWQCTCRTLTRGAKSSPYSNCMPMAGWVSLDIPKTKVLCQRTSTSQPQLPTSAIYEKLLEVILSSRYLGGFLSNDCSIKSEIYILKKNEENCIIFFWQTWRKSFSKPRPRLPHLIRNTTAVVIITLYIACHARYYTCTVTQHKARFRYLLKTLIKKCSLEGALPGL